MIAARVVAADQVGPDIRALTFAASDGRPLPAFAAGSHVTVQVPGTPPVANAYSLACSPLDPRRYRIAVRRLPAGRGGSRRLHEAVGVGDELTLGPPANLFPIDRTGTRHLLVSGGIGVTPFVAYAHELAAAGVPFELHHVARGNGPQALVDEIEALAPGSVVRHHAGAVLLQRVGEHVTDQPLGTHLSVCGPPAMIDAVLALARAAGWPAERLHSERFVTGEGPLEPCTLELARSRRTVPVAQGVSLLAALEAAGVPVPHRCRQGVCGECRTTVLAGAPDHRDDVLTERELESGRTLMPCVSRCAPHASLLLDL